MQPKTEVVATLRSRLLSSDSLNRIVDRSKIIVQGTKVLVEQAKNFKAILGSSKGRDKICSIIQYTAKFVYTCHIHSNIPEIQEQMKYRRLTRKFGKLREDKLMSARVHMSMSRNRKIFNLFKFVDELYHILRVNGDKDKEPYLRFFATLSHCGAFFYYALDNLIFLINTRIVSSRRSAGYTFMDESQPALKYYRYLASAWRTVFNLITTVLELRKFNRYPSVTSIEKEKKFQILAAGADLASKSKETADCFSELFDIKFKKRINQLEVVHSFMRIIMLWEALNLP